MSATSAGAEAPGRTGLPVAPTRRARVLFVFLDGVGLGADDPDRNPFAAGSTPFLRDLLGGPFVADGARVTEGTAPVPWRFVPLDATLGWDGLPQSATGQTTLLTGRNGADLMDGHYGPWPGPTLRRALDDDTLFHRHGPARLANAYPPGYFAAIERGRMRRNAPVYAAQAAGIGLPDLERYREGGAVAADLTGAHFRTLDGALPEHSPRAAGELLAGLAGEARFTFFDFWLSDRVGHRADLAAAVEVVEALDAFLAGVWSAADASTTVVVTSDHGNLEDAGVGTHTRMPVPLLVRGPGAARAADATSLLDVAPLVAESLAAV